MAKVGDILMQRIKQADGRYTETEIEVTAVDLENEHLITGARLLSVSLLSMPATKKRWMEYVQKEQERKNKP